MAATESKAARIVKHLSLKLVVMAFTSTFISSDFPVSNTAREYGETDHFFRFVSGTTIAFA